MKFAPRLLMMLTLLLLFAMPAACKKEGPAEEAGEKIDEAVEHTGDEVEDATHRSPGEKAADKVEDAADKVEDSAK